MRTNCDERYKNMLAKFRINDLQTLLGAFGQNNSGRTHELKDLALELLITRPTGINQAAYVSKISELYYLSSPETVAQIKFKKLPFYEVFGEVLKPTFLAGTDRCTLNNFPTGSNIFCSLS